MRDIGAYEYDAVGAAGRLACHVAPVGPLPDDFGARFYAAKQHVRFEGLSGVTVAFDGRGNRDAATASYRLSNMLLNGSSFDDVCTRATRYSGSDPMYNPQSKF